METFIAIVHVLTALVLIALVLIQDSKSDGLGGAFGGGGSNSILGATGATSLAQKLTRGAAVVFALTSIGLTTLSNKRSSVVDDMGPTPAAPVTTTQPVDANAPTTTTTPAGNATTTTTTPPSK